MREGIKPVIGPGLVGREGARDNQLNVNDMVKIRKLYDLVFTITVVPGFADLNIFFIGGSGLVFMMDDQTMQNDLGSDAEGKNYQHQPAQNSPYG